MAFEIAVPEDDNRTFGDYLDALKRRRKPALVIALSLLLLGGIAIFLWPNAYTSTAVILIEDPDIPPGLVPTTVTTYASKQIQVINQRVMTRTNLAQIIEKFDLFPEERKYLPTQLLVPDVEKKMSIDVIDVQQQGAGGQQVTATIAFKLGFQHKSPATAKAVANELVSLYLAENVRSRTEKTAETSNFMQAEVDRLDTEVKDLETQIAAIKRANEGSLPELMTFNMQLTAALDNDIGEIDRQLQSLRANKIMLSAELARLDPIATTVTAEGRPVSSPQDQLKALQTELAQLEARYSPEHPDVLRVRRDLAAVRAQLGADIDLDQTTANLAEARLELAKAKGSYTADSPQVQRAERLVASLEAKQAEPRRQGMGSMEPDNPVYIQIRAQRATLEADEQSLVTKQTELRARRAELERKMLKSSDVERDLGGLMRRYQTATLSYQSARERLVVAKMASPWRPRARANALRSWSRRICPCCPRVRTGPCCSPCCSCWCWRPAWAGPRWRSPWTRPSTARGPSSACRAPRRLPRFPGLKRPPIARASGT